LAFFADILAEFAILGNVGMLMILTWSFVSKLEVESQLKLLKNWQSNTFFFKNAEFASRICKFYRRIHKNLPQNLQRKIAKFATFFGRIPQGVQISVRAE
jgi:hypothetical protein